MRFAVDRKLLHKALTALSRVVGKSSPLPILHNVSLVVTPEGLVLTGTNMEVGIQCRLMAEVEQPGALTLPIKTLGDLLGDIKAEGVRFETSEKNTARVTCGKSEFTLYGLPATDFPSLPTVGAGVSFTMLQAELAKQIRSVIHAAAEDPTRPILSSVCFNLEGDVLESVATNTHRFAFRTTTVTDATGEGTVLIPSTSLQHLMPLLDGGEDATVTVLFDANQVGFETPVASLICRRVEGTYLKYRERLPPPDSFKGLSVMNQGELMGAVRRAASLASEEDRGISLDVEDGRIMVRAGSVGVGDAEEHVDAELTGEMARVVVYAPYLLPAIAAVETTQLILEVLGNDKPIQIRPMDEENFRQVLQIQKREKV